MAQRLVRTLCKNCREEHPLAPAERDMLNLSATDTVAVFRAKGCHQCKGTGYRGRTGIYELIMVDDALRAMIHDGVNEQRMEAHCRQTVPGIFQDGINRILAGETSMAEVLRVTRAS
jgi:general secretion pathway protein E